MKLFMKENLLKIKFVKVTTKKVTKMRWNCKRKNGEFD